MCKFSAQSYTALACDLSVSLWLALSSLLLKEIFPARVAGVT